jgi:hypothetical protein
MAALRSLRLKFLTSNFPVFGSVIFTGTERPAA